MSWHFIVFVRLLLHKLGGVEVVTFSKVPELSKKALISRNNITNHLEILLDHFKPLINRRRPIASRRKLLISPFIEPLIFKMLFRSETKAELSGIAEESKWTQFASKKKDSKCWRVRVRMKSKGNLSDFEKTLCEIEMIDMNDRNGLSLTLES